MSTILEKAEKYYLSLRKNVPKHDIEEAYGVGYIDGLRSAQNEIKRLQEIIKTKTIRYEAYTPYLPPKVKPNEDELEKLNKKVQEFFKKHGSNRRENS